MSKTKIKKCDRLDFKKPEYLILCTMMIPRAIQETEWPKGFERGVPRLNRLFAKRPAVLADGKEPPTVGREFSRNHLGI